MIQSTSISAYKDIRSQLGFRQLEVLDQLKHGSATIKELSVVLNRTPNEISPRLFELREKGIVFEGVKRACRISGRTAIQWCLTKQEGELF